MSLQWDWKEYYDDKPTVQFPDGDPNIRCENCGKKRKAAHIITNKNNKPTHIGITEDDKWFCNKNCLVTYKLNIDDKKKEMISLANQRLYLLTQLKELNEVINKNIEMKEEIENTLKMIINNENRLREIISGGGYHKRRKARRKKRKTKKRRKTKRRKTKRRKTKKRKIKRRKTKRRKIKRKRLRKSKK